MIVERIPIGHLVLSSLPVLISGSWKSTHPLCCDGSIVTRVFFICSVEMYVHLAAQDF